MLSWLRTPVGVAGYWSLAGYAKRKVKSAVSFIYDFEQSVVRDVKGRGYDGVICGHIHAATIKQINGVTYINCGDWVDSCTAIVEHFDGRMELIEWGASAPAAAEAQTAPAPALADPDGRGQRDARQPTSVLRSSLARHLGFGPPIQK